MFALNTLLFRIINDWAGYFGWLDAIMIFLAQYLYYLMVFGVLVAVARHFHRWRDMGAVAIGSAFVARFGVAEVIRFFYYHPRPYWVLDKVHLLLPKELESSFPSGHTIFVFALAMGVYLYNKKWGRRYFWLAALVGLARVFVGVHWPFDIIAGAVLGPITAVVCDMYYRQYKHKIPW